MLNLKQLLSPVVSIRSCVAELVGTCLFIAVSTGTAVSLSDEVSIFQGSYDAGIHTVGTAMAFGLSIVSLAYMSGHTSGGHFNPAVSFGLFASGNLPLGQMIANIASQILGALLGSALLLGISPTGDESKLAGNSLRSDMSTGAGFLAEALGTFILVLVVLQNVCDKKSMTKGQAPLPIGFAVLFIHLFLIPYTSCSINPARALSPAVVSGVWGDRWWIFFVAPFAGALAAVPFHFFFEAEFDWAAKRGLERGTDGKDKVVVGEERVNDLEETLERIEATLAGAKIDGRWASPGLKVVAAQRVSSNTHDGAPHAVAV